MRSEEEEEGTVLKPVNGKTPTIGWKTEVDGGDDDHDGDNEDGDDGDDDDVHIIIK